MSWLAAAYPWILALHIVCVIAWMAGLLYLPRLFVYHADTTAGSEISETFKVMERRLYYGIMTPAMIATIILGGLLITIIGFAGQHWLHVKLVLVLGLIGMHHMMARWRRDFAADRNRHPARFFRIMNEVPTLLMLCIVILAVVKPF